MGDSFSTEDNEYLSLLCLAIEKISQMAIKAAKNGKKDF